MAVAAPKRRSSVAPSPSPSRTTAPKRSQPRTTRRPAAKPTSRAGAAAPARAPARRVPARAPQRARPKRSTGGQPSLAIAVGRTAATVRHLPDSGLIVRMTRGRTWIAVLGVLLVGIVALNVVTLSFAATAGKVDGQITELEKENSMLRSRVGEKSGIGRVRSGAAEQGLVMPNKSAPQMIEYGPGDLSTAAQRLAAAG